MMQEIKFKLAYSDCAYYFNQIIFIIYCSHFNRLSKTMTITLNNSNNTTNITNLAIEPLILVDIIYFSQYKDPQAQDDDSISGIHPRLKTIQGLHGFVSDSNTTMQDNFKKAMHKITYTQAPLPENRTDILLHNYNQHN